ncbi:unnamed protein product [Arctia plantaginis]|uniref:Uncharacterized protein n=1 Tax=Arctia plantaginis TaxID=874455 RepID=A0A8S1BKH4_ARCPL|nr:unnamed protein product [Arctia plantaginis]
MRITGAKHFFTVHMQAPDKIERCSQLTQIKNVEQNGEGVKPPDIRLKNHKIRDTEVSALNIEIETLRWQLAQTESNRQMHIALLKQVVTFLSRVKEHIEHQSPEPDVNKEITATGENLSKTTKVSDLPRSRSVLHVNKHEFSLSTNKKLSTRKISKSISNVNGYKDFNSTWNQSKLSLTPDPEGAQKIKEEISRLISLANSVLSTKLPDLAYKCNNGNDTPKVENIIYDEDITDTNDSTSSLNFIDEDATNAFILNTIYDSEDAFRGLTQKYVDVKDETLCDFIVTSSPRTCGIETDLANVHVNEKFESIKSQTESKTRPSDKRTDYTHVANFIEDESGFSSMSSFQEIGIPIISIIPPSPCKEVEYIDEFTNILDEAGKWKSDTIDLDQQTVKVFWV